MRRVRRPRRSMVKKERGVERTLTMLIIMVIRKGAWMPDCWKKVVP